MGRLFPGAAVAAKAQPPAANQEGRPSQQFRLEQPERGNSAQGHKRESNRYQGHGDAGRRCRSLADLPGGAE
jgi:hypothetical protein